MGISEALRVLAARLDPNGVPNGAPVRMAGDVQWGGVVEMSVQYDDPLDPSTRYALVEPAPMVHFTVSTPSPELMRILLGEVEPLDIDYDDRYLDEIDTDIALEREWQGRLRAERQTAAWKHPTPHPDPTAVLDEP